MAALIPDARSARAEARRLRDETVVLKFAVRRSAAHSRVQLRTAETALDKARASLDEPLPSPWSTLLWNQADQTLGGVLVSVH